MYDETKLKGVGARIRNLRAEQELTQFELAEKIGVSQTHLSNIECGRVQISLKLLLRIANVLERRSALFRPQFQSALQADQSRPPTWAQHDSFACSWPITLPAAVF